MGRAHVQTECRGSSGGRALAAWCFLVQRQGPGSYRVNGPSRTDEPLTSLVSCQAHLSGLLALWVSQHSSGSFPYPPLGPGASKWALVMRQRAKGKLVVKLHPYSSDHGGMMI